MTKERSKPITLTVSAETREWLAAKARQGFRSLNREVAMRIEESCARDRSREAEVERTTKEQQ